MKLLGKLAVVASIACGSVLPIAGMAHADSIGVTVESELPCVELEADTEVNPDLPYIPDIYADVTVDERGERAACGSTP